MAVPLRPGEGGSLIFLHLPRQIFCGGLYWDLKTAQASGLKLHRRDACATGLGSELELAGEMSRPALPGYKILPKMKHRRHPSTCMAGKVNQKRMQSSLISSSQ